MPAQPDRQTVEFEGRRLVLTHLDKVLYPATGFTKAHALHYYQRIAEVMLRYCAGRPASFVRAPEGPAGQRWYAKNPPPGLPGWVTVEEVAGSRGTAPHVVVDSAGALLAVANLGAWEVHVPQWTIAGGREAHDRLVLDLDPGPGADLVTCCRIAEGLRELLADDGLTCCPVVSGSKGLHLYAAVVPAGQDAVRGYARSLARRLQARDPDRATAVMAKTARTGKVLIDWSQNASAKTTAAPYTLRLAEAPAVAAPVGWEEVEACRDPRDLRFSPQETLDRVRHHGDLLASPGPPSPLPDPL